MSRLMENNVVVKQSGSVLYIVCVCVILTTLLGDSTYSSVIEVVGF